MLGKLIKNEFKSSSHFLSGIYMAVGISVVFLVLAYMFKIKFLSFASTLTIILLAVGVVLVTLIFVVSEFYKTLYGNQGYLSFSLPVKSRDLIASKAIVSIVWVLLSYVIGIGLFIGMYIYLSSLVGEDTKMIVEDLLDSLNMLPSRSMLIDLIVIILIMLFIQIAALISEIYFAITLANTRKFQKHGIIFALLIFFAVYIMVQGGMAVLTVYFPLTLKITMDGLVLSFSKMNTDSSMNFGIIGSLFQLIMCFLFYFLTSYLMRKKVNVK
ncbi:MAG: hypothetical protein K5756_00880 [Clostridiales bacterium]|nr:hypothetical protein [Clostridiales bacterium]